MILDRIFGFIRRTFFGHRRQENAVRRQESAWPEIELIGAEKAKFKTAHQEYTKLVQRLILDCNPKRYELSQKYHTEASQLIYCGFFHIDDFHDMREVRRALQQIITRIETEAAQID